MQKALLDNVSKLLQPDGPFDADSAAAHLAELLGFEQLDLISALVASPAASVAALQRHEREQPSDGPSAAPPSNLPQGYGDGPQYPNVFTSGEGGMGTTRVQENFYEEITMPPSKPLPYRTGERLVPLEEMDHLCQGAFRNYKSLNRLQSAVYPTAYGSNENMLVCAPTGAGKTDVAMLTVLRCVSQYATVAPPAPIHVRKDDFKIVYVAPMKALVSEIVAKFSKRLSYLGLKVRELTGDMQLTRKEMAETQMIVTTPEKWDVVTRKPTGNGELALKVRLLIIDEVHLLHEARGAVIETLVARTQRLVESTQSMIRIVGLSATLPNYVDVAEFLGVNLYRGMYYFGGAFRPVPLEQHFIGVRGKSGTAAARGNLDRVVYEKILALAEEGHPAMVFVHTRKDTVRSAESIIELGKEDGISDILTANRDENRFEREVAQSRNRELRELYKHGIGIHHAGMLRSDRDLSERMFATGVTRVLCCTSTLAWGVNLPAYAVIIKGTDVYDADAGRTVDLSILDVLQIFGRAGRPQYEDVGVSYICTGNDKLSHYIDAITSAHPIESSFLGGLVDALNAEVSLGSVSSVSDGISWLGYTYLYTRMKRSPLVYGIDYEELAADPSLAARRREWITGAARVLHEHKMATFDESSGALKPTSTGRIAARYYLGYRTIEVFNERLRNTLREADSLDLMSRAADFSNVPLRESEEDELDGLLERIPCQVPGGSKTAPGKVNILLQAHVSRLTLDDFALVSDSRYVTQNAGRVLRALFELALDRSYAGAASALLNLTKAVEHCVWPFEHPLRQMKTLNVDALHRINQYADELEVTQIRALSVEQLAKLLHSAEREATAVHQAAARFPRVILRARARPVSPTFVRIDIQLLRDFEWDERVHGGVLPLIVWVEDALQKTVHVRTVELRNTHRAKDAPADVTADVAFSVDVPLHEPALRTASEASYSVVWASETWLGAEGSVTLEMDDVCVPQSSPVTPLLELPVLSLSTCVRDEIATAYSRQHVTAWNAVQTQVFHSIAYSRAHVLVCAPPGAGKRTVAEQALWRGGRAVLIFPSESRARAAVRHLESLDRYSGIVSGVSFIGDAARSSARVLVGTPACILGKAATHSLEALVSNADIIVLHDMHIMSCAYELAVMQLLDTAPKARRIATSACLVAPAALAAWLGISAQHTYSFAPHDQPYPVTLSVEPVDIPPSSALVRTLIKPAFERLRTHIAHGPGVLVVPNREQCSIAANELVSRIATDIGLGDASIAPLASDELEMLIGRVRTLELANLLRQGVALWHSGIPGADRGIVRECFAMGAVRIAVCARDNVEGLPFKSQFVAVLGVGGSADYSPSELLDIQSMSAGPQSVVPGECVIYALGSHAPAIKRGLSSPLFLESELGETVGHACAVAALMQRVSTAACDRAAIVAWLSKSFFALRVKENPWYYGVPAERIPSENDLVAARISDLADHLISTAVALGLATTDAKVHATHLGTQVVQHSGAIELLVQLAARGAWWLDVSPQVIRTLDSRASEAPEGAIDALVGVVPESLRSAVGYSDSDSSSGFARLVYASWLASASRAVTPRRLVEALLRK
ncbi:RNA helicase [Malassezia cuniculi]|uniref:RNA helicase n=1 Tax=Malassezia cuniculi TaxID=948313 RepID=A0AAF0ES78_9BASI|nr:RNA helicase [Malassezia cuniculi]